MITVDIFIVTLSPVAKFSINFLDEMNFDPPALASTSVGENKVINSSLEK